MAEQWNPFVTKYDPLKCGSIDGTDNVPHDHAVVRAMNAKYKPNKNVKGDPKCTVFVGRLNVETTEDSLMEIFSKYGEIKRCRVVRDLVTGASKCYGFVEYYEETQANRARRDGNKEIVDDKEVLVEFEIERTLEGWIPRRFGGGLGGKKEAGQLRFGGRERPFRKPIKPMVFQKPSDDNRKEHSGRYDQQRSRDSRSRRYDDRKDRYSDRDEQRRDSRGYRNDRRRSRSKERN